MTNDNKSKLMIVGVLALMFSMTIVGMSQHFLFGMSESDAGVLDAGTVDTGSDAGACCGW